MALEGTEPTLAQRHALAKLSELFAAERVLHSRLAWISRVNGAPYPKEFDRTPGVRPSREEYFLLLSNVHPLPTFPIWMADLLETMVEAYGVTRSVKNPNPLGFPPMTYPSKQQCRKRMIEGYWGWDLGLRAIQLLGYDLAVGKNALGEEALVLKPVLSEPGRKAQQSRIREALTKGHDQTLVALDGAYDVYLGGGADSTRQAMDSLRNALENLVRDFTHKDLGPGLSELSDDDSKRLQLFKGLRDFLSVGGTHANDQPGHNDFYLAANVTEDAMVWILQKKGEW